MAVIPLAVILVMTDHQMIWNTIESFDCRTDPALIGGRSYQTKTPKKWELIRSDFLHRLGTSSHSGWSNQITLKQSNMASDSNAAARGSLKVVEINCHHKAQLTEAPYRR